MRRGYDSGADVVLGAKRGRALLRVLGESSIRDIRECVSGRTVKRPRFTGYSLAYVALHENNEASVYLRSHGRLWRLFTVYILVAALALSGGGFWQGTKKLCKDIYSFVRQAGIFPGTLQTAENSDKGDTGFYEGEFSDSNPEYEKAAVGKLVINSGRQGIIFANADISGMRFGYAVYADGILLESAPYAFENGSEYNLTLYGRIPPGEHEILVDTYCYYGEDRRQFDVVRQKIEVFVEEN